MASGYTPQYPPHGQPMYPNPQSSSPVPPYQYAYGEPQFGQQQPPPYQQPQAPYPYTAPPNAEVSSTDNRGILGAVAGGAVGGYAGHQVHHGILGTIGGAITGSIAEDAIKDRKHKKQENEIKRKEHHQNPPPYSSPSSDHHDRRQTATPLYGNFSASSVNIALRDHCELTASCRELSGHRNESRISLNNVLENQRGHFKWVRGGNFRASARNVRLVEGGRVLEAELADGYGGWNRDRVRLDEMISNQNGNLVFLD
ncbi:hypothetical protein ARAM_004763 [Aspergillus rambellii]|uniref:Cyanovirin-N domain-containing protein n=3 Tax=Aspergillus subgen. Nidulantes TaxID=2720870 RepID=A0A0F8UD30_9EURO|nr:hypothetical protein ARAM_004763 [Aspergillus rambellii]